MNLLSTAFAQDNTINLNPPGDSWVAGASELTITGIVSWAITAILIIAAVVFFFMLIIGGIKWIMSGGDKQNTESARNQITAALIGLIIVFSAWAIMNLLGTVFGIELLGDLNIGSALNGGGGGTN